MADNNIEKDVNINSMLNELTEITNLSAYVSDDIAEELCPFTEDALSSSSVSSDDEE